MKEYEDENIDKLYGEYSEMFYQRLGELFAAKDVNISKIADQLRLSTVTIYKYLKGISFPTNINERLLSYILNIDPRYFYDKGITVEKATQLFFQPKEFDKLIEIDKIKEEINTIKDQLAAKSKSEIKEKAISIILGLPEIEVEKIVAMLKAMYP